jgi:hypothetical protein
MPDTPIAIMSAHLWDLRAQCEHQVTALSDAQQQLDAFRDGKDPGACDAALEALQADLARVVQVNRTVREAAQDAVAHAQALASTVSRASRR